MEETFTDYNTFFGHYLDDYLIIDKLILKIKAGINQLVMKILNQDCKNIVIVEKKGIKLFHHTFNKLISNGFTIASIRFLKIGDEIFFIKNLKPEAKEIVLCTDAINKGKELSNIISHFNKSNIIVKHVYSYFANPNGIKNITKSTQIKENQISYHELFDFNKLRDISNQLTIFFSATIEPSDIDHIHGLFSIIPGIDSEKKIIRMLNSSLPLYFQDVSFKATKKIPTNNIRFFTMIKNSNKSDKRLIDLLPTSVSESMSDIFDLSFVMFRSRFTKNRFQQDFSIMCYSQIDINLNELNIKECPCYTDGHKCYLNQIELSNKKEDIISISRFCSLCIENILSKNFLKEFEKNIINNFKIKHELVRRSKFNPIEGYY